MSGRAGAEGDQPLRRSAHSGPACRPYADFPGNPTARLKPCPDTKPKTKPRVPLRSDSCEFRRIGSSATFVSHTPGWEALRRGIRLDYNGATKRGTASGDTEWSRPPLVTELVGYL